VMEYDLDTEFALLEGFCKRADFVLGICMRRHLLHHFIRHFTGLSASSISQEEYKNILFI
jgi:hypothetical protein